MSQPRPFDVEQFRMHFPSVRDGVTSFFDGPGGSQTPEPVADAIRDAVVSPISNRGRVTATERVADEIVVGARQAVADLLGSDPGGVVFGRSMTQLTYDLSRAMAKTWRSGDEVVVSRLDHDANVRPWVQAAQAAGATIRWADFDPATGELDVEHLPLSERTRLVAVTGASNLIGTRPPVRAVADAVHSAGALLFVDGVHLTAHEPVDVADLGADVYAFSPYKLMGPHLGVLAASPQLLDAFHPDKLQPSSNAVPERYELGTLPYESLAGVIAMVDFVAAQGSGADRRDRVLAAMTATSAHEQQLATTLEAGLHDLGATVWSRAAQRTPTLLATFERHAAADAHAFLAERGVNAPAGSFYAVETAERLGLGTTGGLRMGIAPYTSDGDVRRLLEGLADFVRT